MKNTKRLLILTLMIFFLILIDQLTKWLAIKYFSHPWYLIGDSVRFVTQLNDQVAFSLPIPGVLVTYLTPLFILLFMYIFSSIKFDKKITYVMCAQIFAGTIGNFIDRLRFHGAVVDFIAIGWYPVFNVADVYLTVGLVGLFLLYHHSLQEIRN